MSTKQLVKEEAKEVTQFDSDGRMLVPVKENGKVTLQTQEAVKQLLEKKNSKQKSNTKRAKKHATKQVNPEYRDRFADLMVKRHGVERVNSGEKVLVKYGSNLVVRLMLRKSHRFTAYKNTADGRTSVRIVTDKDEEQLEQFIVKRCDELKNKPSTKPKKKRTKKSKPTKTPEEYESDITKRMDNLSNGSNGISIPLGVTGSEDWFELMVQKNGWTVDLDNRTIAKVKQ